MCGDRIVILTSMREDILCYLHECHHGLTKCCKQVRMSVWWLDSGMDLSMTIILLIKQADSEEGAPYNANATRSMVPYWSRPKQALR